MAISLDGVQLNPDLVWVDEFQYSDVAQAFLRTLGGSSVVFSQQLAGGRPITLEARTDQGWLTRTQVKSVESRSKQAGATFTLVVGSQAFRVMFRHHDGVAFTAEPLIARVDGANEDYYAPVSIKLITV